MISSASHLQKILSGKEPVTVFEIEILKKSTDLGKDLPSTPLGTEWTRMRRRPLYLKKIDAEMELSTILAKKYARPADHYRIAQMTLPMRSFKNELASEREIV